MSDKVKVPGGAFYAGDGLTVDPVTRTVSAGGGSEVSTPDWNQNDPTSSDYIKNRPGGYDAQQIQTDSGSYKFTYLNGKGTYNGGIARDIISNSQTVDVSIFNGSSSETFKNVPVIQDSNGNYIGDSNLVEYPFCLNYPEYEGGGMYGYYCYTTITPYTSGGSLNISVTGMGALAPVKFDDKYIDVPANIGIGNTTSSGWESYSFAIGTNNHVNSTSTFAVGQNNATRANVGVFGIGLNGDTTLYSSGAIIIGQYNTNPFTTSQKPTLVLGSGNAKTKATVFWADATTGHFLLPVVMTECQPDSLILKSSTSGSKKKFKITVDDTGTITATETT